MGMETTVRLELTSADTQGALNEVLRSGLSLYSVWRVDELVTEFTVRQSEMGAIRSVLDRRGDPVRIIQERGLAVILKRSKKRPVLLMGLAVLIILTVFLPTRLILFRVEGSESVSPALVLETLQDLGVTFWTKRVDLHNENIKNGLIDRIPGIAWVGINTKGCVATVSIRERADEQEPYIAGPGNIYATRDGIISEITASKGTAMFASGDAVLKGQLLISGFTDCGNILLSGDAEGDVYAYTSRSVTAVLPKERYAKMRLDTIQRRYSLVVGKKRINFWKGSGISPIGCDRMYQEYWLKLPGGGVLPVCVIRETIIHHSLQSCDTGYAEEDLASMMDVFVCLQIPGGKILHRDIRSSETDTLLITKGHYGCLEMIGKKIVEQIGENVWQER